MAHPTDSSRPRLRRVLAYGGLFVAAFLVTLYWSFPYDLVARKTLSRLEAASGLQIEMASVRPHWLTGLAAESVRVRRAASGGDDALDVSLDRLTARVKPLASLFGGLAVAFDAENQALDLEGTVVRESEERYAADVQLERLDLGGLDAWEDLGVRFAGVAEGTFTGAMPPGRPDQLTGELELTLHEAVFEGGNIKGFTVPPVRLGDVRIPLVAEEGTVKTQEPVEVGSPDLEAELSGEIQLRPRLAASRADLEIRFKPTEAFWSANQKMAGLVQGLLRNAEGKNGFYAYQVQGVLGRPSFRPKR